MKFLISTLIGFSISVTSGISFAQDELYKPLHGGELVKARKTGLAYEVVRKPKEVLVYPVKEDSPAPNALIMKFKNKSGVSDQIQLKLMPPKEQGMNIYSAPVPASVYISGGVTFEVDFGGKRSHSKQPYHRPRLTK